MNAYVFLSGVLIGRYTDVVEIHNTEGGPSGLGRFENGQYKPVVSWTSSAAVVIAWEEPGRVSPGLPAV